MPDDRGRGRQAKTPPGPRTGDRAAIGHRPDACAIWAVCACLLLAVAHYRKAVEIKPEYAEAGRFPRPWKPRRALDLAAQQKKQALALSIQAKIWLYETGTPFHEAPVVPAETPRQR